MFNSLWLIPILAALCVVIFTRRAEACTGVYVGKKCSADGSVIIARSLDYHPLTLLPHLEITPEIKFQAGRTVKGTNGFIWELPENTYKYISVPLSPASDCGIFASVASNDQGLSITATVTGHNYSAVKAADPNVPDGVTEEVIPSVIAPICSTAREAVRLLASILDKKGSNGQDIVMFADKDEAWYMEIYSGHQYCAVKMPEDKVAAFGNEFLLGTVNADSPDTVCSEKLFSLPKEQGFAEYDQDGNMHISNTYAGKNRHGDYAAMRTWIARRLLAPSLACEHYDRKKLSLFFVPDKKISVCDLMSLYRNRYEHTELSPDETGRNDVYVIGTEAQQEVHIVQVFDSLPKEMNAIIWLTLSEAAYVPFVPISSLITGASDFYTYSSDDYSYSPRMAYCIFKQLNTLCARTRESTGEGVKAYWRIFEKNILKSIPGEINKTCQLYKEYPAMARKFITKFCETLQDLAVSDSIRLYKDVMWYLMQNTETMKHKYGGEFIETYPEEKEYPAFEASFNVEYAAKLYGWDVEYCDNIRTINLTKNGRTITVTATSGHRNDSGSITISDMDRHPDYPVSYNDGAIYLPLSAIKLLEQ